MTSGVTLGGSNETCSRMAPRRARAQFWAAAREQSARFPLAVDIA